MYGFGIDQFTLTLTNSSSWHSSECLVAKEPYFQTPARGVNGSTVSGPGEFEPSSRELFRRPQFCARICETRMASLNGNSIKLGDSLGTSGLVLLTTHDSHRHRHLFPLDFGPAAFQLIRREWLSHLLQETGLKKKFRRLFTVGRVRC